MQLLDTVSWKPLYISKKNQILKPFTHVGTFQTTDLRKRFNKALLDNSSFERQCIFCNGFFKDLLQHQLFYCHGLSRERTKLFDALALLESTESNNSFNLDKHQLLFAALTNRNILSKLGNFLEAVKY